MTKRSSRILMGLWSWIGCMILGIPAWVKENRTFACASWYPGFPSTEDISLIATTLILYHFDWIEILDNASIREHVIWAMWIQKGGSTKLRSDKGFFWYHSKERKKKRLLFILIIEHLSLFSIDVPLRTITKLVPCSKRIIVKRSTLFYSGDESDM